MRKGEGCLITLVERQKRGKETRGRKKRGQEKRKRTEGFLMRDRSEEEDSKVIIDTVSQHSLFHFGTLVEAVLLVVGPSHGLFILGFRFGRQ
jgi:hypothetical protein